MTDATYMLEIKIRLLGPPPEQYNRGAPEVSDALYAAVDAAKAAVRNEGYVIVRTGYGAYRVDEPSA